MNTTFLNLRDLDFLLYEWLDAASLCERERYAHHSRETFDSIIETAAKMAQEHFLPHAAKLDANEPTFDGERVHLIPEVKAAIDNYLEAGFLTGPFDEDLGGMQLPYIITVAYNALFNGANVATMGYPFLTGAAANLLSTFGSDQQKDRFVKPMLEGRFFGTMCLSEPQAGSSLADITTKATPTDQGDYLISGSKMWISGGEHDLSENIIHLVLAKIPGGPPGVKGISLFIVPKYRLKEDGTSGEHNDVRLAGLNHKMGWRGTVNTVLNFGEAGDCRGILIGEPHKGLRYMFHMMNEARIGVGFGAATIGYAGYMYSLDYAKTRKQGRLPSSKDPSTPPVRLIEHADVKRMLLAQKSYVEGALALGLFCAKLVDEQQTTTDDATKDEVSLLLDLLTPIAKAWPSTYCLKANELAIQVLGGYGYSREYPVERLYRDNRLNPIHEGTNGIQALDLLGRKVTMKQGAALLHLSQRIEATIEATKETPALKEFSEALAAARQLVFETTQTLMGAAMNGEVEVFLANASEYMDLLGHVVIAWLWLEQAQTANHQLATCSEADKPFYLGKLRACQYFYRWELPHTQRQAALLQSLDDTCLRAEEDWF